MSEKEATNQPSKIDTREKEHEELLWKQTGLRIIREVGDDYVMLKEVHYPLEHQGWYNEYRESVILDSDNTVRCWEVRINWNGTGSTETCYVELTDEEAAKLREMMLKARKPEDFDEIREYIGELNEKYEEEWDEVVGQLVEELTYLSFIQEKIRLAKDEEVKRNLIEYIREKIEDYFAE
jgi:hypothetical protein